jgi:predicted flap endonuclease-1-like 5' DNA nuclease
MIMLTMKEKHSYNFLIGLILGTMACLIIWYWQKTTRAEDGALDLLDRLKVAETKLRQIGSGKTKTAPHIDVPQTVIAADDLKQVKGIGPVFAERLASAGVHSFIQLAHLSAARLATILEIQPGRAERILAEVSRPLE